MSDLQKRKQVVLDKLYLLRGCPGVKVCDRVHPIPGEDDNVHEGSYVVPHHLLPKKDV